MHHERKRRRSLNLRRLTVALTKLGMAMAVEIIASARVPIVKYVDSESGITVDVSFNTDSALSTSEFVVQRVSFASWLFCISQLPRSSDGRVALAQAFDFRP